MSENEVVESVTSLTGEVVSSTGTVPVEIQVPTEILLEPLTRLEREEIKVLSLIAFGNSNQWNKLLKNGEKYKTRDLTRNGDPIEVTKVKYFTIQQIKEKMEAILKDREEQQAKAAAAVKAKEIENETKENI